MPRGLDSPSVDQHCAGCRAVRCPVLRFLLSSLSARSGGGRGSTRQACCPCDGLPLSASCCWHGAIARRCLASHARAPAPRAEGGGLSRAAYPVALNLGGETGGPDGGGRHVTPGQCWGRVTWGAMFWGRVTRDPAVWGALSSVAITGRNCRRFRPPPAVIRRLEYLAIPGRRHGLCLPGEARP